MQPKIHHILLLAMVLFLPVVLIVFPSAIAWGANLSIPATVGALDCSTFGGGVKAGDTLTLAAGTRGPLTIRNCTGSASNPITIQNSSAGQTTIQRTSGGAGSFVFVCDDCVNVVIDGTVKWPGAPAGKSYGIKVTMTGGGSPAAFVKIGGKSRFLTIRGVEVDGAWPRLADNGIGISVNDHAVDAVDNPGLWREGIIIEKSYIHHVEGEGLYVGPNVPQGDIPLRNISIRDNIVEETGWDGINLKSAIQGTNEIHHNVVRNVGKYVEPNPEAGQRGGISLYEGNGRIYNNWVQNAGESAITLYNQFLPASYGTQSVEIFNNVVINAGVTGPLAGKGISVGSTDSSAIANTSGKIYNNTVVDSEASGIVMGSRTSGGFIRDNIVVDSGASDISAPTGASVTNNRIGTKASVGFVNAAALNFRLTASSPARNSGSNVYPSVDIADVARPLDGGPDQGAYEGATGSLTPGNIGSIASPDPTPPSGEPPVCVEPPVITPGPITDRNIYYYSGFESGRVNPPSNRVDGMNIKTLTDPQIGDAYVQTNSAGGASPTTNWDTKVVASETVGGQTVLPRSGSYFLRSAIYFTKDYLNYNNGDSDKPRALMLNYQANTVDFDEEAWVGFSLFLPKNWEHELGVRDHRGGNMLFVVNAETDSTFLALHPYVPPGETVTHWKLMVQTNDSSAYEASSAGEVSPKHVWVDLGSVVPDLGMWTDFVIRFRANPFSVTTNPAAKGIRDSVDKTYEGNRGILQVWKAEGPADASGSRAMVQKINKVNVPVGLVPLAGQKLRMDLRQYKYGWKKNPTTVRGPVWVGFDEFRFGVTSRDQTGFADVAPGGASAGTVIPPGSDPLCTTPPVTPPICAFTPIRPPFSITNDKTDSHRFNLPPNTIKKIVVANLPQSATCRTSSGSTNSWRPSGGPWCTVDGLLGDTWSYTNGTTCSYSRDTITDKTLRVGISTTPGDISAGGNMVLGFGGNVLGYCGTADQMAVSRAEFIVKTFGTPGPGECVIKPNVDYYMNVGTLINLLPRNPRQTTDYYGIVMSDNVPELPLGGSAPTVTSPVVVIPAPGPIPSPSPAPITPGMCTFKWNPGHYMLGDRQRDLATNLRNLAMLSGESAVKGFVVRLDWGECETTQGNYSACFNYIDAILAEAKSQTFPKHIMIAVEPRQFGGTTPQATLVPPYLRTPTYNGGIAEFGNGFTARTWEANVMDRYIALQQALGARYDSDPYVEMVFNHAETALGWGTQPVPATYTKAAYRVQILRELQAMRAAWPNTLIKVNANFMSGEMETIFAALPGLRIGAGGPDILPTSVYPGGSPHSNSEADRVYMGIQGGIDYRGIIPYSNENQSPVYSSKEGAYLPREIYDQAKNVLQQHHILWVRMWTPTDEASFDRTDMTWPEYQQAVAWSTGILPFLRANPTTYGGPIPSAICATTPATP